MNDLNGQIDNITAINGKLPVEGNLVNSRFIPNFPIPKMHKCGQCDAVFGRTTTLRRHMLTHTGERPHKCDECGATFTSKGNLKLHIRRHTGETPYKCDQCGAGFAGGADLKVHIRRHAGEKPYKCDECGSAFVTRMALRVHSSVHTGVKAYECSDCGRGFSSKVNLARHVSIHADERKSVEVNVDLMCFRCYKTFESKDQLNLHSGTHPNCLPYSCKLCGAAFASLDTLTTHTQTCSAASTIKQEGD